MDKASHGPECHCTEGPHSLEPVRCTNDTAQYPMQESMNLKEPQHGSISVSPLIIIVIIIIIIIIIIINIITLTHSLSLSQTHIPEQSCDAEIDHDDHAPFTGR